MSVLSLISLCRFCALEKTPESLLDLRKSASERSSVILKLGIYKKEIVDFEDRNLPETVCIECLHSINASYDFSMVAIQSQIVLKKALEACDEDIKKNKPGKSLGSDVLGHDSGADEDIKPVIADKSWSSYPWRCPLCEISFPSVEELRAHSQLQHKTCNKFGCDDCDKQTDEFEEFVEHVRKHRPHLKDFCQYCNLNVGTPAHLNCEIKIKCPHCGQAFPDNTELQEHLTKYAKNTSKSPIYYVEITNHIADDPLDTKPITYDATTVQENNDVTNTSPIDDSIYDLFETDSDTDDKPIIEENEAVEKDVSNDDKITINYNKSISNIKIDSWSEYPCVCKYCDRKFKCRLTLTKHCIKIHEKCFGMKCIDCENDPTRTFLTFEQHVKKHRPNLIDICPYCDISMTDPEHLQTHMGPVQCTACGLYFKNARNFSKHHAALSDRLKNSKKVLNINIAKKIICDICGKFATKKSRLAEHIKNHMKKKEEPKPKEKKKRKTAEDFECNICHKRLTTTHGWKSHMILHTERSKNYTCDRCGKSFYEEYGLIAHRQLHEPIKKEICKICGKYFINMAQLKKHVFTHNIEKKFQCDVCKKFFKTKENIRLHVAVHMDVKPNKCRFCSKRFKNKSTLRDHLRLHTGQRPYSCEECCRYFACWASCEVHMRRHHGRSLRTTVLTERGRLALDPATGLPAPLALTDDVQEWTRNLLKHTRRKAPKNE